MLMKRKECETEDKLIKLKIVVEVKIHGMGYSKKLK